MFRVDIGHHNAVQVSATGYQRVFPADQCRELSWLVVRIGRICNELPGIDFDRRLPRNESADAILFPSLHRRHGIVRGLGQNRGEQLSSLLAINRIAQQILHKPGPQHLTPGEALCDHRVEVEASDDTEVLGMVRHHEKIQRRADLHARLVSGMHDRHALGIAISSIRGRRQVAVGKRIRGIGGMQVGIAPQELLFLCVGGATNGDTCCDRDSHHAGIGEQ